MTSLRRRAHWILLLLAGCSGTPPQVGIGTLALGMPPTITNFTPTSGTVGTSVTITGTSFTGATAVRFATTAATFKVVSATSISATVPGGAMTGPISVTTAAGTG